MLNECRAKQQHCGEFILLGKQAFGGSYKTHGEAMKAGIGMFGPVRLFLVEQNT